AREEKCQVGQIDITITIDVSRTRRCDSCPESAGQAPITADHQQTSIWLPNRAAERKAGAAAERKPTAVDGIPREIILSEHRSSAGRKDQPNEQAAPAPFFSNIVHDKFLFGFGLAREPYSPPILAIPPTAVICIGVESVRISELKPGPLIKIVPPAETTF